MSFNNKLNTWQQVYRNQKVLKEYEKLAYDCWCIPQNSRREQVNRFVLEEMEGHIYTCMDMEFFQVNQLDNLVSQLSKQSESEMTYKQIKGVRRLLGKPRRFSLKFLMEERLSLQRSRRGLREESFKDKLKVGQALLCRHPVCNHYHPATVLTWADPDTVLVKFHNKELGSQSVKDYQVIIHYFAQTIQTSSSQDEILNYEMMGNKTGEGEEQLLLQDIDYNAMAGMFLFLDRKARLISIISQYNKQQAHQPSHLITDQFRQHYGWIGYQVHLIDQALKSVTAKFRLRGIENIHTEDLNHNIDGLLIAPLKDMIEKEIQLTNDPNTINKLKELLHNVKEEKIQQKVQKEVEDKWEGTGMEEEGEEELRRLQQNCLGVLYSLNEKEFRFEENIFLKNLLVSIEERNPKEYEDIKKVVDSIIHKISVRTT